LGTKTQGILNQEHEVYSHGLFKSPANKTKSSRFSGIKGRKALFTAKTRAYHTYHSIFRVEFFPPHVFNPLSPSLMVPTLAGKLPAEAITLAAAGWSAAQTTYKVVSQLIMDFNNPYEIEKSNV